jgi:hypothetical protein
MGGVAVVSQREEEKRDMGILPVAPQPQALNQSTETTAAATTVIENNPVIEFNPQFNPQISVNNPTPADAPQTAQPSRSTEPVAPRPQAESPWGSEGLPTENIAPLIASQNHSLIVAITDSGKTTSLCGAIRHRYETTKGHCEFWIADPKGSSYMGLNRSETYLRVRPETVDQLPKFLDAIYKELTRRIDIRERTGQPTTDPLLTVILDEWPSMLKDLKRLDPKKADQAASRVEQLIFMGREDRVSVWMVTQSHLVKQNSIDSTVRDNMAIFAQGRKDRLETLARIADDFTMIPNRETRQELAATVKDATGTEVPLCLTQIGGPPRVFQVADLRDYINWQYPLDDAPVVETEVVDDETEPAIAADATPQQKGKILQAFREGQDSEAALIGFVWPGVMPSADEYPDCRAILRDVLSDAGLLREWDARLEAKRIPRK